MMLHDFLDLNYGPDGDDVLQQMLRNGTDLDERQGLRSETPLHVAARRRRVTAVKILLYHGANIDARTAGGKTAYAHVIRRRFDDLAALLIARGANPELNDADRFAVAIVHGRLDEAHAILAVYPDVVRTGNAEEDRLLADVAGRNANEPVDLLIQAGADLAAPGLDSGTPLHQAAWFGQPDNARLLIDAGAPLDVFEPTHESSPLGWAVHGSRYSGGAGDRQDAYVAVVRLLIEAGSSLNYTDDSHSDVYFQRLLNDASPPVREILRRVS